MKLKTIIEELEDTLKKAKPGSFSLNREESAEEYFVYNFEVGERKFEAEISGMKFEGRDVPAKIYTYQFGDTTDGDIGGYTGITGKGNVKEVFKSALEILKDFFSRKPNVAIAFSGDYGSRDALYARFAKKVPSIMPGYTSYTGEMPYPGNIYVFPEKIKEEIMSYLAKNNLAPKQ